MGMFDQTQQQPYGVPMGGYQYNGFPQQPKVMNVLSEDEIKELQAQRSQFSLGLTERESKQAACNHRSIDGTSDSLVYDNETGIARCTICGYEFRPIDADTSPESIRDAADRIVDILQTIKLMYTDILKALNLPCVVVADAGLGTINHTVLTLSYLRQLNFKIKGVILNRFDSNNPMHQDNLRMVEDLSKTKVIAVLLNNQTKLQLLDNHQMEEYFDEC